MTGQHSCLPRADVPPPGLFRVTQTVLRPSHDTVSLLPDLYLFVHCCLFLIFTARTKHQPRTLLQS